MIQFIVPARNPLHSVTITAAQGDITRCEFDFAPWEEDNSTITSVTWVIKSGSVDISDKTLVDGLASAILSFQTVDVVNIEVTAVTATVKKVIRLKVRVGNEEYTDGYES